MTPEWTMSCVATLMVIQVFSTLSIGALDVRKTRLLLNLEVVLEGLFVQIAGNISSLSQVVQWRLYMCGRD